MKRAVSETVENTSVKQRTTKRSKKGETKRVKTVNDLKGEKGKKMKKGNTEKRLKCERFKKVVKKRYSKFFLGKYNLKKKVPNKEKQTFKNMHDGLYFSSKEKSQSFWDENQE